MHDFISMLSKILFELHLKLILKIKDGQAIPHFPGCPCITPPGHPEQALLLFFFSEIPSNFWECSTNLRNWEFFLWKVWDLVPQGLSRPCPSRIFFAVPGTGGDGQARPAVTPPSTPGHLSSERAKIGIVTTNKDSLQNPGAGTCRPRRSGLSLPSFPELFAQSRLGKIPIFPSLMNSWLTEPPC